MLKLARIALALIAIGPVVARAADNDFGLPPEVAALARTYCAEIGKTVGGSYQIELACMKEEAKAYLQLHPPVDETLWTKDDCDNAQQHDKYYYLPTLTEQELELCYAGKLHDGQTQYEKQYAEARRICDEKYPEINDSWFTCMKEQGSPDAQ